MIPFVLISGLLGLLLWHICFGPDIWYHLFLGKSFLETGSWAVPSNHILVEAHRINIYWLFQIISYESYKEAGIYGLTILFAVLWAGIFWLWVKLTRSHRSPVAGALLFLATVVVVQIRFEFRPEVFSYLFLLAELNILQRQRGPGRGPRREQSLPPSAVAALVFIQILWTNCHGFFILGPVVLAAWILAESMENRRWSVLAFVPLIFVSAATLCSPFGWKTWALVLNYGSVLSAFRHKIEEADPPYALFSILWTVKVFVLYWILTAAVLTKSLFAGPRKNIFENLTAAAGLLLSAMAFRNIPLVLFLPAPLWATVLPALEEKLQMRPFVRAGLVSATAATAVLLSFMTVTNAYTENQGGQSGFGMGLDPAYPIYVQKFLETNGNGNGLLLFNNPADGGFLEFHLPELRLFGDSFFTDAPADVSYFCALKQADCFEDLRSEYHFNSALLDVSAGDELALTLFKDPRWKLAEADLHHVLFVFSSEAPSALTTDIAIYRGEDLSRVSESSALIRWSLLAGMFDLRNLLMNTLSSLTQATEIPSTFFQYALTYGIRRHDGEMLRRTLDLYPKMKMYPGEGTADAEALTRLAAQASQVSQQTNQP